MGNDKLRYGVRILVAAYLFYLAYQIAKGVMSGDASKGLLVAVFGFIAAGCFFIWQGVHGFAQLKKEEIQAANELSAERAEEAKAQMKQIEGAVEDASDAAADEASDAVEEAADEVSDAAEEAAGEAEKSSGDAAEEVSVKESGSGEDVQ